MIRLLVVLAALATEPVVVTDPPAAPDAQAAEDARVTDLLVRLNFARVAYLEQGLALVDHTERQCTSAWADELTGVRREWDTHSERLLTELKRPGGEWAPRPSDAAVEAARPQILERLDQAEAEYIERVRLMNQLMERCPEHREAIQGIYALGKHGFIIG